MRDLCAYDDEFQKFLHHRITLTIFSVVSKKIPNHREISVRVCVCLKSTCHENILLCRWQMYTNTEQIQTNCASTFAICIDVCEMFLFTLIERREWIHDYYCYCCCDYFDCWCQRSDTHSNS